MKNELEELTIPDEVNYINYNEVRQTAQMRVIKTVQEYKLKKLPYGGIMKYLQRKLYLFDNDYYGKSEYGVNFKKACQNFVQYYQEFENYDKEANDNKEWEIKRIINRTPNALVEDIMLDLENL